MNSPSDTDPALRAKIERGACSVCGHGSPDPLHDKRSEGFHEYTALAAAEAAPLDVWDDLDRILPHYPEDDDDLAEIRRIVNARRDALAATSREGEG